MTVSFLTYYSFLRVAHFHLLQADRHCFVVVVAVVVVLVVVVDNSARVGNNSPTCKRIFATGIVLIEVLVRIVSSIRFQIASV